MCELARNSILQSGWELQIKRQWLGKSPPLGYLTIGDDLETVQNTNVPAIRLAFRREMLNEEKRLMMLFTTHHISRANTNDTWYSDRPSSRDIMVDGMKGLPSSILGMFKQDGLDNVEEASEEGDPISSK